MRFASTIRRHGALAVVAACVVLLAAWRVACVRAGPDVDSDAYGHHMIARQILVDPGDLAVNWVWLPLFHYVQVPLVWLGGTMDTVRFANVALAAALPIVLFFFVRAQTPEDVGRFACDAVALLAAILAALCPIAMQMGTTAQPEPAFALLILGTAIALERRRSGWAALMLSAAAMLRYEAWAVVPAIAVVFLIERKRNLRAWLVVALPLALIFAWAALRRPVDGAWFAFLGQTRTFANDALKTTSALDGGAAQLVHDLLFYAVFVPWRIMGPTLLLVPLGVWRTWQQEGHRFVIVFVACLGFVTLSWITRSSLGLDRHFVELVPLYATAAAHGVAIVAEGIAWCARKVRTSERVAGAVAAAVGVAIGVASVASTASLLDTWMGHWRAAIEHGWPDRVAMGAFLRTLPASNTIFCDEATLEILSGVDRRRFDRHWVDAPATWSLVDEAAERDGAAYVATWGRKMKGHEGDGEVVYRLAGPTSDDAGLAVMRVVRKAQVRD
jgi:hypothetical protein